MTIVLPSTDNTNRSLDPGPADKAFKHMVSKALIPGAIYAVKRGDEQISSSFGTPDITRPDLPFRDDTIVRIMSMSKSLVAAATMLLQDDGLLNINDPVHWYIPEFKHIKVLAKESDLDPGTKTFEPAPDAGYTLPDGFALVEPRRPMTIKHCLQHTSGVGWAANPIASQDPVFNMVGSLFQKLKIVTIPANCDRGPTLEEHIKIVAKMPLWCHPGDKYWYAKGVDIASRVVEAASKKSLDLFMKERLFEPLEMVDTGFTVPQSKVHRFHGMQARFDAVGPNIFPLPPDDFSTPLGSIATFSAFLEDDNKPPRFFSGTAGCVSSLTDYMNYVSMLRDDGLFKGKRVLTKGSVDLIMSPGDTLVNLNDVFASMTGSLTALGGACYPSPGVSGVAMPAGTYYWGGYYTSTFFVDRKNNTCGVAMSQVLTDLDKHGATCSKMMNALAFTYI